jgi:CBS domain-containing protein
MSPRAAWRLETLGFERVHDFVGGKMEWLAAALPTEGTGPHHAVAGEALTPVPFVRGLGTLSGTVRSKLRAGSDTVCAVINEEEVVLGRVRWRDLPDADDVPVEDFMQPGPATVRTIEELGPLVRRMQEAGVGSILVTNAEGRLLGLVRREDAERVLHERQ